MPRVSGSAHRADPTIYPVSDDVGESTLHGLIAELLRPLLERWFKERRSPTFVGADQFIYWKQFDATRSVSPDVYVLPGVAPDTSALCWKTWLEPAVPSFALEIVSTNKGKDYLRTPRRHTELGTGELVIFDPWPPAIEGFSWQVFHRVDGRLLRVEATSGDRVRSKALGCWLRAVGEGDSVRVRVATGPRGDALFPTEAEAERARAEAERGRAEAERGRAEAATKGADKARRALASAERARRRAEAELARLRKTRRR